MTDPIPDFVPPPNLPVQIRCPLTLKRLDEIERDSDEHIIHEALGGPRWYSVKADADENSRFGSGPDARFVNSIVVKAWRIHHGILGKSGDSTPKFNPVVYSFQTFVPVIQFRMSEYWLPDADRGRYIKIGLKLPVKTGAVLQLYFWTHLVLGWVVTTLFAYALTVAHSST